MKGLVIATRNRGKALEIAGLLGDVLGELGVTATSLADYPQVPDVEENGVTFAENARTKAVTAALYTGMPALADDSGLAVEALGGLPGVRSARFAGPRASDGENNRYLLERLAGTPRQQRKASFRCVMALARPDGKVRLRSGAVKGVILEFPRGDGGFGYDPLFFVEELGRTFAELSLVEKNRFSHRGRALQAIRPLIRKLYLGEL